MQFSPLTTPALILAPLRYFFSTYGAPNNLTWSEDPHESKIEIDYYNNLHKVPIQEKPRILVDRGGYAITKTGITDNLASGKAFSETQGLEDRINFIFYQGTAQIFIEARQQGVCELITDMATHFIVWSRPMLCDTQGFKEFGMPMQVGGCQLTEGSAEDGLKFQVEIGVPYIKEEHWRVRNDGVLLKAVNVMVDRITQSSSGSPS